MAALNDPAPPAPSPLPAGVRARRIEGVNGLSMHVLEAGYAGDGRPCVLLLHGFPELAYSFRHVLAPLAAAGYHVIAPDQRGYGATNGADTGYDCDLAAYRMPNLATDALALVRACGHEQVACVVGHDFGSPVAAWCALVRPDVFRSVVLMSAPFAGPPALLPAPAATDVHAALAALPRPRRHYQRYYCTREANTDLWHCPQGVHAFLRAYYHHKSADWPGNAPHPLPAATAAALAALPEYYVMDLDRTMPATVAEVMPTAAAIAACRWLPEPELAVYSTAFAHTGFQGGLNWYRAAARGAGEMRLFAGRTIDVPACFIAGRQDWGVYQSPGAVERMQQAACSRFRGLHLVDGAGHWVQQEQPARVVELLLAFLRALR
jgi:pimeloyl-ACP methyl ester carboxylesterase